MKISEKLNGLQSVVENEKQTKNELLENKIKLMEDQFEEFQEGVLKKYNLLKDNVLIYLAFLKFSIIS